VKLAMNPWFYAAVLIQLLFWIILIVFWVATRWGVDLTTMIWSFEL
jgi:hypothetical protein